MKKIAYDEYLPELTSNLPDGAFLTVKNDNKLNTMTIGWGLVGYIWGTPVFTVAVRDSRFTFQLIENTDQFTVSVPFTDNLKEELSFCGTESGRDYDKFRECNLEIIEGIELNTPLIKGCDLHYECQIRYKQAMDRNKLDNSFDNKWYPDQDYHTLYYGEIVAAYREE